MKKPKRSAAARTRVAVLGGSGYTGIELLRILALHPDVEVTAITSEKSAGKTVADLFPHLRRFNHLTYQPLDQEKLVGAADLFFLALPHGASQEAVHLLFRSGKPVIDLSADYRLRDRAVYQNWYGIEHRYPGTLAKAVYGLPEIHRARLSRTRLVANPGCYPTSAILGLMPALKAKIIDPSRLVIDSKSGTSGAGRKADITVSFCEVNEGFKAYGIGSHRHTPEIEQELSAIASQGITVNFTPHLLPVDRGILATIYAPLTRLIDTADVLGIYRKRYEKEPFVRICSENAFPNIKNVRGTNVCEIGVKVVARTKTLIIVSAIDNLVKGASGQAVQNMNILLGLDETTALGQLALLP